MRFMPLRERLRRWAPLVLLVLPGCAGAPPIATIPAACSTLLPDSWRTPVPGAPLPREEANLGDWIAFADAQTAQLDKANGRLGDTLSILQRCEARDAAAAKARSKAF